jgi:hypothetical protein
LTEIIFDHQMGIEHPLYEKHKEQIHEFLRLGGKNKT